MAGDVGVFNWESPRLRQAGLSDLEASKWFVRLTINESILKLIAKGKGGQPAVAAIAGSLHNTLAPLLQDDSDIDVLLGVAVKEVSYIAEVLLILVADSHCKGGHKEVQMLDKLRQNQSTTIQIFATMVFKTPWWKSAEVQARQRSTAVMTHAAEMKNVMETLKAGKVELKKCGEITRRVTVWRQGVPEGSASFE